MCYPLALAIIGRTTFVAIRLVGDTGSVGTVYLCPEYCNTGTVFAVNGTTMQSTHGVEHTTSWLQATLLMR